MIAAASRLAASAGRRYRRSTRSGVAPPMRREPRQIVVGPDGASGPRPVVPQGRRHGKEKQGEQVHAARNRITGGDVLAWRARAEKVGHGQFGRNQQGKGEQASGKPARAAKRWVASCQAPGGPPDHGKHNRDLHQLGGAHAKGRNQKRDTNKSQGKASAEYQQEVDEPGLHDAHEFTFRANAERYFGDSSRIPDHAVTRSQIRLLSPKYKYLARKPSTAH